MTMVSIGSHWLSASGWVAGLAIHAFFVSSSPRAIPDFIGDAMGIIVFVGIVHLLNAELSNA
jgi:hypothetical protein